MALTGSSWGRVREIVKKRDKETCVYCDEYCPNGEVDHILPLSKGGNDNLGNLAWTCSRCNREKRDKSPREWIIKANETILPPLPLLPSQIEEAERERFDLLAAGWDCDCGGYGYCTESWLPAWGRHDNGLLISGRPHHGHHHPDCPIIDSPEDIHYSPYFSKLIDGEPYLFDEIWCNDPEEKEMIRRNDFWHRKYRHHLDWDVEVRRCSEEAHDKFRAYLRSNEFNIKLKMKRLLVKAKQLEQEPSNKMIKNWVEIIRRKLIDWGLIYANKKTA